MAETPTTRSTWSSSAAAAAATPARCARPSSGSSRAGREGQGRRHLPAPRLHPDQGAAARRARWPTRRARRAVRRHRDVRGRRHGRRQHVQGRRRRPALQGPAGPDQEPAGITVIEGEGTLVAPNAGRGRRRPATTARRRAGLRLVPRSAARPRDRRRAGDRLSEQALQPATGPEHGDRARRRRDRRRVRQRRGARSAPRSRSSRRCPGWSRPRTPSRRKALERAFRKREHHASRPACAFQASTQDDAGVTRDPRETARRSRPTCCSSRSAAARRPPGSDTRRPGIAMERGFVSTDERLRDERRRRLRGRRHRARAAARAPRLPAGHLRGRGDRRARPPASSTTPASPG